MTIYSNASDTEAFNKNNLDHLWARFKIKRKKNDALGCAIIMKICEEPLTFKVGKDKYQLKCSDYSHERIFQNDKDVTDEFNIYPLFEANYQEEPDATVSNLPNKEERLKLWNIVLNNRYLMTEQKVSRYTYTKAVDRLCYFLYNKDFRSPDALKLLNDKSIKFEWFDNSKPIFYNSKPILSTTFDKDVKSVIVEYLNNKISLEYLNQLLDIDFYVDILNNKHLKNN